MLCLESKKRTTVKRMSKKSTKRALIVIAILLLIGGAVFGFGLLTNQNAMVASNPANIDALAQEQSLEAIADEQVPLAGTDEVQVVPLITDEEPILPTATNTP